MSWSSPLSLPVTLRDGRRLQTLREAAELFFNFVESRQGSEWNVYAVELLKKAAEPGDAGDIQDATVQVRRASGWEGML